MRSLVLAALLTLAAIPAHAQKWVTTWPPPSRAHTRSATPPPNRR